MTQYCWGQCVGMRVGVNVLVGVGVNVAVGVGVSVGMGVSVGTGVAVGDGISVGGGTAVAGIAVRVGGSGRRVFVAGIFVGCIVNKACATNVGTHCAISVAFGVGCAWSGFSAFARADAVSVRSTARFTASCARVGVALSPGPATLSERLQLRKRNVAAMSSSALVLRREFNAQNPQTRVDSLWGCLRLGPCE